MNEVYETFDHKGNSVENLNDFNQKEAHQQLIQDFAAASPASARPAAAELTHLTFSNDLSRAQTGEALSLTEQASVFGGAAAGAFAQGVRQAITAVDHVSVPGSQKLFGKQVTIPLPCMLETAAASAAIGFAARTLLPETGMLGKVGGAALGALLLAPVAGDGYKIFNQVRQANGRQDLQFAGQELGMRLGSLSATMPVGIAGYEAGASLGASLLSSMKPAPLAAAADQALQAKPAPEITYPSKTLAEWKTEQLERRFGREW